MYHDNKNNVTYDPDCDDINPNVKPDVSTIAEISDNY